MRKWLRDWRFSLKRLVIAMVFLGAFFALNSREIGPMLVGRGGNGVPNCFWGWPLPVYAKRPGLGLWEGRPMYHLCHISGNLDLNRDYSFPLTHQAYRLVVGQDLDRLCSSEMWLRLFVIVDFLLALTVLALILFLQIPRRKVAAKGAVGARMATSAPTTRLGSVWPGPPRVECQADFGQFGRIVNPVDMDWNRCQSGGADERRPTDGTLRGKPDHVRYR